VSRRSCSACRLIRILSCCSVGPPHRNPQRKTRSRGDGSDNSCNHYSQCRARCCASLRARVPHVARKTFEAPHLGSDHRGDHQVGWGKHSDREPRQRKAALRPTLALRLRVAAERSAGGVCQDVCCGSRPTERTTRALSLRAKSNSVRSQRLAIKIGIHAAPMLARVRVPRRAGRPIRERASGRRCSPRSRRTLLFWVRRGLFSSAPRRSGARLAPGGR
jgi:hypothetical protein